MARTKSEVRAFLNQLVGQSVNAKSRPFQGQCVSLIKALLEFLGVPNPYSARGNAKDVGDTLLRQGIAKNGRGWLTVCVNRTMGRIGGEVYGHIWLDLLGEANFEQNGNRALYTTKNTRPVSQAQQFVNLDKYIKDDPKPTPKPKPTPTKGDYKVVKTLKGYVNSANAKARKGSNSIVPAGTYYTFSQANGMRNITRVKGQPGWWINPGDNKAAAPAPKKVYVTVKSGWGLSQVAQAAGFKDAGDDDRWAAIAKLNGSSNWRKFNADIKPGQKVRVK